MSEQLPATDLAVNCWRDDKGTLQCEQVKEPDANTTLRFLAVAGSSLAAVALLVYALNSWGKGKTAVLPGAADNQLPNASQHQLPG
jgi:hypothetical protein